MKPTRKRILLADCHADVLVVFEKLLEDAGFETTTVWTAQEVLDLVETQVFDIMVVNKHLPDAECEQLLKRLQQRGTRMPCIVMQSSSPEITDVEILRKLGAREIVCKQAHQQVVDAVSRCLRDRPTKLVA